MSYKFIKTIDADNPYDNTFIEHTVNAVAIPELMAAFEDFLKGAGFVFDGHIELVIEEE